MLFWLFKRLIFFLIGVGIIILGITLNNFVLILAGVCCVLLHLATRKWKHKKKRKK